MNTLTHDLTTRIPRSLLFAVLALSCLHVQAANSAPAPQPPLPAKYETYRTALQTVLTADQVPGEEKALLGAWCKDIEKAFRAEWQPTVALFQKSKLQLDQLGDKVEAHNVEVQALVAERAALNATDYDAVVAYNARADAVNARKADYDAEKEAVLQVWAERCDEMEAWLDASAMASFVERTKQTLRNCYGEAYQQLLGLHEGTLEWGSR